MRKIFIDGGAHNGESIDVFRDEWDDHEEYEIHSFEPNEDMWGFLEKKNVILHKEALWDKDCEKEFFKGEFSEGSTLMKKKVTGKVDYNHPFLVKCIRLSSWIRNNFSEDDYIVLKLDIEGAEYAVFEDMFATDTMKYINELCGELHNTGMHGKIRSLPEEAYGNLKNKLDKLNIEFRDWHNNIN